MKKKWIAIGTLATATAAFYVLPRLGGTEARPLTHRLVYISRALTSDEDVDEIRGIVERAAKHGYNGVVFASRFDAITLQPPEYFRRLGEVKSACDSWGLDIIASMFTAGYGGGVLAHNKNLAAVVPVKDAVYVVHDGMARPFEPEHVHFTNGDFEKARGQRLDGYKLQDAPGSVSFVDGDVRNQGRSSLRLEGFEHARHGNARVMQELEVERFHSYRISCWMRLSNVEPAGNVQVLVRSPGGRTLMSWQPDLEDDEEWHQVVTGFNSLDNDRVRVYMGMWAGRRGRLWIDDVQVEETGPVDVVRRPGTPVSVTSYASGMRYDEGRDFEPLYDPKLDFRFDHRGPPIRILEGSRIGEGDRLHVSYYQAMALNRGQVPVCMAVPEVFDVWREALEMVHDTLQPAGYLLAMDEVRAGGWCETCMADELTAAERLGRCITRQVKMIEEVDTDADIFVWSDMLDPNHNARADYFLYKGDFDGSWRYVPKNLIIACWYYDRRKDSLRHFDRLGFRTIAAAYYDADDLVKVEGWLDALKGTRGGCGIMYTTWDNKYELLESFGDLLTTTSR
jgi:hypothetical protein